MRYYRNSSLTRSLCIWLLHTGINRKEAANETNWVVCVLWKEQPVLSQAPSHSSVTGWLLSGLLFFSLLWLDPGKVNNRELFFPSFPQDILLLFSTLEAELGWDDPAQSQPALWCRVCTQDVHGVLDFNHTHILFYQLSQVQLQVPVGKCVVPTEISSQLNYFYIKM